MIFKEERKFGPLNLQTREEIGPGCYIVQNSMIAQKKRISIKEPFSCQVNRQGKNAFSLKNLNEGKLPPYYG